MLSKEQLRNWENRESLRDEYERTRIKRVDAKIDGRQSITKDSEDHVKPRHQTNCPSFRECAFDYKCRNYDPRMMECVTCPLNETKGICHKRELHTDANMSKLISRPRLDLDKHLREVKANG